MLLSLKGMNMRILFCGGGTAGHVNPSIAVAEALLMADGRSSVAFVGRKNGRENAIITDNGYKLYTLDVYGLKRSFSLQNIKNIYKALLAEKKAKEIIREFTPDAVFGTGGYVSLPVLRAAIRMKIPAFIHESNSAPGLVTRLLAKKCTKVFLGAKSYNESLNLLSNVMVTGTPIRGAFGKMSRRDARRELGLSEKDIFIVSAGGSIGAERFNSVIIEVMKRFSRKDIRIKHTHASGARFYESIKNTEPELCRGISGCKIIPYINNMPTLLSAADIAITRCGAATLAELALCATPSILIPSPNVTDDHQKKNAEIFENTNAALMLEEKYLSYDSLIKNLTVMLKSEQQRRAFSKNIKKLSAPNAAKIILEQISENISF